MPTSSKPPGSKSESIDWLAVKKTLVVEVVVLLAVLVAAIQYVNWSSDVAQAEFARAMDAAQCRVATETCRGPGARSAEVRRVN